MSFTHYPGGVSAKSTVWAETGIGMHKIERRQHIESDDTVAFFSRNGTGRNATWWLPPIASGLLDAFALSEES